MTTITADPNCLSLVPDDGKTQTITFKKNKTENDVKLTIEQLRTRQQQLKEVRLRDVQVGHNDDDLLALFFIAIRSHLPSIQRLCFENSTLGQSFGSMLLLLLSSFATTTTTTTTTTTNVANYKIPALEFRKCCIHSGTARALYTGLTSSGMIHTLTLDQCSFIGPKALDQVAAGLRETKHLQSFSYTKSGRSHKLGHALLFEAIQVMLASNKRLETLCLGATLIQRNGHAILQAIQTGQTLKTLRLLRGPIRLATMQHIIRTCAATESLQELDVSKCRVPKEALGLLLETLSATKPSVMVETLHLPPLIHKNDMGDGQIKTDHNYYRQVILQVPALKVSRLVLHCQPIVSSWASRLVNNIAKAGHIQHLDLFDCSPDLLEVEICHLLMLSSRPMELRLGSKNYKPTGESIMVPAHDDYYRRGCCPGGLKTITCRISGGKIDLLHLARRLAHMPSLRKLTVHQCKGLSISGKFLATLATTLKKNQGLCTLALHHGLAPARIHAVQTTHDVDEIQRSLAKNRMYNFMENDDWTVPTGLWASLLGRASLDRNGIFRILTNKPDLLIKRPNIQASEAPHAADELDDTGKPTKRARYF